ncbi:hypothetical protein [Streptomyces sp. NPDC050388]|uniref:hypothetical protein n=1 Tax=Streptomyces sp. NPDC050388 TaxID=3155781 RepID=UPI0034181798
MNSSDSQSAARAAPGWAALPAIAVPIRASGRNGRTIRHAAGASAGKRGEDRRRHPPEAAQVADGAGPRIGAGPEPFSVLPRIHSR